MSKNHDHVKKHAPRTRLPSWLNEDWLSVILAFVIILLAAIGLLGPNGLHIRF
jgi:hypothetical protein